MGTGKATLASIHVEGSESMLYTQVQTFKLGPFEISPLMRNSVVFKFSPLTTVFNYLSY